MGSYISHLEGEGDDRLFLPPPSMEEKINLWLKVSEDVMMMMEKEESSDIEESSESNYSIPPVNPVIKTQEFGIKSDSDSKMDMEIETPEEVDKDETTFSPQRLQKILAKCGFAGCGQEYNNPEDTLLCMRRHDLYFCYFCLTAIDNKYSAVVKHFKVFHHFSNPLKNLVKCPFALYSQKGEQLECGGTEFPFLYAVQKHIEEFHLPSLHNAHNNGNGEPTTIKSEVRHEPQFNSPRSPTPSEHSSTRTIPILRREKVFLDSGFSEIIGVSKEIDADKPPYLTTFSKPHQAGFDERISVINNDQSICPLCKTDFKSQKGLWKHNKLQICTWLYGKRCHTCQMPFDERTIASCIIHMQYCQGIMEVDTQ